MQIYSFVKGRNVKKKKKKFVSAILDILSVFACYVHSMHFQIFLQIKRKYLY